MSCDAGLYSSPSYTAGTVEREGILEYGLGRGLWLSLSGGSALDQLSARRKNAREWPAALLGARASLAGGRRASSPSKLAPSDDD